MAQILFVLCILIEDIEIQVVMKDVHHYVMLDDLDGIECKYEMVFVSVYNLMFARNHQHAWLIVCLHL